MERISLDMADCKHFKRKRSQNSARSLNCNEWKSALTEAIIVTADVHLTITYDFSSCFLKIIMCSICLDLTMSTVMFTSTT